MASTAQALVTWTHGRPQFTRAGLRHYAAACAECHIEFMPQAVRSAGDLCRFLRTLLHASMACRAANAATTSRPAHQPNLQSLARLALDQVARAPHDPASAAVTQLQLQATSVPRAA